MHRLHSNIITFRHTLAVYLFNDTLLQLQTIQVHWSVLPRTMPLNTHGFRGHAIASMGQRINGTHMYISILWWTARELVYWGVKWVHWGREWSECFEGGSEVSALREGVKWVLWGREWSECFEGGSEGDWDGEKALCRFVEIFIVISVREY